MMSGSRCVKRYQKIFLGFLIKSARFLLKIKKNLSVVEIYRRKNLSEDVLMTGAEESGLICVPTSHQLGLFYFMLMSPGAGRANWCSYHV